MNQIQLDIHFRERLLALIQATDAGKIGVAELGFREGWLAAVQAVSKMADQHHSQPMRWAADAMVSAMEA
jgi:hypothetical protein